MLLDDSGTSLLLVGRGCLVVLLRCFLDGDVVVGNGGNRRGERGGEWWWWWVGSSMVGGGVGSVGFGQLAVSLGHAFQ